MRPPTSILAALVAASTLLACGPNNGTAPHSPTRLDGTCWALEQVTAGAGPDPIYLLWSADMEDPGCGLELCFASRGEFSGMLSCNGCSGYYRDDGDAIEILSVACGGGACPCGPPLATLSAGSWPVANRDGDVLVVEIPAITPGGGPARWHFRRLP